MRSKGFLKLYANNFSTCLSLSSILIVKAFLIVILILYGSIGLGPDEAQYWSWSQQLDWGYYSKPPGIAWQIWLSTKIFGNTELGVRFLSIIISFILSLAIYAMTIRGGGKLQTAFWATLLFAFSPLGWLSSFLAITDLMLVFSWTIASFLCVEAIFRKREINYIALGLIIFMGALFKWPIYLFWPLLIIFSFFYPPLFNKKIVFGIIISLFGLLPSIIWNASNNWVTFRHVFTTVTGGHSSTQAASSLFKGNFLEFFGMQFALVSPLLFLLLLMAFFILFKHFRNIPLPFRFCAFFPLIILAAYSMMALFQKMQGNWCDFIYPTAFIYLSWLTWERFPQLIIWVKMGLWLSIVLTLLVFSLPSLQNHSLMGNFFPYRINPFKHNLGWQSLSSILTNSGYNPKKDFLFADTYQATSILSFYGPEQKRAYFLNLQGSRENQFSFWPTMRDEQMEKAGYFVVIKNGATYKQELLEKEPWYEKKLAKYFDKVESLGVQTLIKGGKGVLIFKCIGYNGKEPPSVNRY